MKKLLTILLLLSVVFTFAFANGEKETKEAVEDVKPAGTTEIVWWTSYGKANVNYLQKIIDAFNNSQSDYHVTIEYQGSANELIAKMQSTRQPDLPALFNWSIENIGMLFDAEFATSLQPFVDADKQGWPELDSTYEANRASYCDQNGELWGYPNGISYPGIYFNADMLAKAGIDPNSLVSLEQVYQASKKLVEGGYCTYGIGFHPSGYYFLASLGREAIATFNNNNGYDGPVTECLYKDGSKAEATVTEMLNFYKKLYAENLAVAYGANYSSEVIPLVAAEDCAMMLGVVSMTTKLLDAVDGKFNVGIIPCPSVTDAGKRTGEPAGGTGIFVANHADKWVRQGAYEFIKFLSKGEHSGYFAAATGYLAPSAVAYESEVYQDYLKNVFPEIATVYDSLANSDDSATTPLCAISSTIKNANKLAIETVANSPTDATVKAALQVAYDTIQESLELYNLANN